MHQGNWKCSTCGGAINELPFEPRSESGLTCRTCYAKKKDSQQADETPVAAEAPAIPDGAELAGEPAPAELPGTEASPTTDEKPKFSGDWKCASCGGDIKTLPFEPRNTENLKCIDCFKKQ